MHQGRSETIRHTAGGWFVAITETSPSAADNMEGVLPREKTYSTTVFDWYSETDTDEGFKLDVEHSSTPSPVDPTGAQPIKLGQVVLEAETTDITGVKHVYTKVMAADPTAGAAVPPGAKRLGCRLQHPLREAAGGRDAAAAGTRVRGPGCDRRRHWHQ